MTLKSEISNALDALAKLNDDIRAAQFQSTRASDEVKRLKDERCKHEDVIMKSDLCGEDEDAFVMHRDRHYQLFKYGSSRGIKQLKVHR